MALLSIFIYYQWHLEYLQGMRRVQNITSNMREKVMLMMLTMETTIPHLMADGKEGEVDDEEDDLVAEQDVGHEGDQGKPGGRRGKIV